tara:strand:+ start:16629 stop:16850 length:222 start_codon:yes stop_codon:yes gene_type:complete
MPSIKPKIKKQESSLEELKTIINDTKLSESVTNVKSILYNNLVKNIVKNIDYLIISGVTFYLTKLAYSNTCAN